MTSRVLSAALAAGFCAALVASLLQAVWTTPLIVEAERFEHHSAAPDLVGARIVLAHEGAALAHSGEAHAHGDAHEDWAPQDGLERAAFTALATLVSGVGYALVLLALLLAAGAAPTRETCLRWAFAGFVAVNLAPAIGLPPELPGTGGGPLALRQAWWLLTVGSTGLGLYLITRMRAPWMMAAGIFALALPHLIGAPHHAEASDVPAGLAAQFATRSLAISLVFWGVLGLALSWAWARQDRGLSQPAAT
jgi:cobalt transporter subunit CbtA